MATREQLLVEADDLLERARQARQRAEYAKEPPSGPLHRQSHRLMNRAEAARRLALRTPSQF